ncbi:dipeptidase [Hydrogenibacillus sp. N12]|uniref:dipeptidase n=1 Tax=Hydrogenibacillus sp. N12 TaxID=2866627 RepID=UPI00207BFBAD|nr:dipeptidase [Hydrogenibacillus sp. N12]
MPTPPLNAVLEAVRRERDAILDGLFRFLALPSVSALSAHKADVGRTAAFLADALREAGFADARVEPTAGHPLVVASSVVDPLLPTVLFYGHYDVQPVDPEDRWTTPPFAPAIRDGRIYARGASDDKGPVWMHLAVFRAYRDAWGRLPLNVKVLIEGEEEIGSPHLEPYLAAHRHELAADAVLISDTTMLGPDRPAITVGLRGLAALEVRVRGPKSDLHSGLYGGIVHNPLQALVRLLATLHDADGRVAVPGFYDDVRPLPPSERAEIAAVAPTADALRAELGVPALFGEAGFTPLERNWARPTLELNGLFGGFQGEGIKTVIPAEAGAKLSARLVPDQDPERILDLVEDHLRRHAPPGVVLDLRRFDTGRPYLAPADHPAIRAAARALEAAFGRPAAFVRMGGSIPIVEPFRRHLGAPIVLMGFGLATDNIHAPDEHFDLAIFDRGLEAIVRAYAELADALAPAAGQSGADR